MLKVRTGTFIPASEERILKAKAEGEGTGGNQINQKDIPKGKRMVQKTEFKLNKKTKQATVVLGSLSYSTFHNDIMPILRQWLGGFNLDADAGFSVMIGTRKGGSRRDKEVTLIGKQRRLKVNVKSGDPDYEDPKVEIKKYGGAPKPSRQENQVEHPKYRQGGGFYPVESD